MKETYLGRNRSCRCERTSATLGCLFHHKQEYSLVNWFHASNPSLKVPVRVIHHICFGFQDPLSFLSQQGMGRMRKTHRHQNSCYFLNQNQFKLNPRTPPVCKADQQLGVEWDIWRAEKFWVPWAPKEAARDCSSCFLWARPGNSSLPHPCYSSKFLKSVRWNNNNSSLQTTAGSPGFIEGELYL